MVDIVDAATRSRMMAGIKGKNTVPELVVRRFLHAHGFRYRLHDKALPGRPDIVLPKYRTVIFVNGCFWHQHSGCNKAAKPSNRKEFWQKKLSSNVDRDRRNITALTLAGWYCIQFWECEIGSTAKLHGLAAKIAANSKRLNLRGSK